MKLFCAFSIFLSLSAFADETFTRMQVENEHYQDYTREEMTAHFGSTKVLLPMYVCNDKDEFDLYWMPIKNVHKNALRIQLYKEEGILIYQNGKYLDINGSVILEHDNLFVLELIPIMKKLESIPETKKMLRLLEQAPFPVTIKFGGNFFNPKEENGKNYQGIYMANAISILDHGRMTSEIVPFYDIGVGGFINWNPKTEGVPGAVTLAHEMYHALDSVRGILDMRFVVGKNYEMALASEYRAVYMENITRKASGIPYRVYYGEVTSGPGVLDELGEPRFISSPCLK